MAYDPNSTYEPPRRAYYGQMQPPGPVQNGSRNPVQEQYDDYAQQSWDEGYDQQYDQYNGYGQDVRQGRAPQSPQYDDGYQGGYQNSTQRAGRPPNGREQQQRQERQYDPRYQQRQERGRQQNYEQPVKQQRPQLPPSEPYQMGVTKPNPRNVRNYQMQNQSHQHPAPRLQDNAGTRPQTAPQPQKKHDPSKMTMEEWKAKERERMHVEAALPETLAWDNAFPTFPTARERSRPASPNRESAEYLTPSTSNGQRSEGRPEMSRKISQQTEPTPQHDQLDRPPIEHKPWSFEPIKDRPAQQKASPPTQQLPQFGNQAPSQVTSHGQQYSSQQMPMADQRQSPANAQAQWQYRNERNVPHQPRQPSSRAPPMQPIDTRQAQQQPRPAYMDHHPLSPANVPQRPSTAQGPRSPLKQSMASPTSAYAPTQPQQDYYGGQGAPPLNASAHERYDRQGSLDDVYYADNRAPPPATAAPRNRDQEIEAEMPDFDSAAPGGTSLLHKRSQNAKVASPPQMSNVPPQNMNASAAPLPPHSQRFYAQQQDPSSRSLPDQRGPKQKQGGITNGFVFGIPGESTQQAPYDDQYGQQGPPGPNGIPYQHPGPPIQPPFAREQQPRRSMDDARQMPYRQGPPPTQRMHPNGQPPRGQYPPQQRPDRNISARRPEHPQPAYSDPVQARGGSAPPMRPAFQGPPGGAANGAPLSQQRSAPEQQEPQRSHSNPDSLPQHPVPVRPGLMDGGPAQASKPPPVRNHPNAPPPSHQRQGSLVESSKPVTAAELDHLRAAVDANPNNHKQALLLARKFVEAADVLASEGGRANPPTVAKNRERYILEAHKRVKKLVAAGYPDAQFYLADCYGQGLLGLEFDPKEAFNLYQAAAKAGHAEAAYRTAMCCELGPADGGGTRQDFPKAVQWYRRGAALGDSSAMFKIGVISLKGLLGQQKNVGEGVSWLKRAAERGDSDNPQAFYELATLYESANTSPEVRNKVVADDQYALELFQKAAQKGHKFAQFRLGQAFEYGNLGLPIDNRQSISWYSKAASQGEHQAELALSGWYLTGADGILEHSDTEAYLWARKAAAAEPPLAKAMFAMGYFTETGIGCPASVDEAKKWYGRAACKFSHFVVWL